MVRGRERGRESEKHQERKIARNSEREYLFYTWEAGKKGGGEGSENGRKK